MMKILNLFLVLTFLSTSNIFAIVKTVDCEKDLPKGFLAYVKADTLPSFSKLCDVSKDWVEVSTTECTAATSQGRRTQTSYSAEVILKPTKKASKEYKESFDKFGVIYHHVEQRAMVIPASSTKKYLISVDPDCG